MLTLEHLLQNLLQYSIHSYIIYKNNANPAIEHIHHQLKKYTNPTNILILDENTNKSAIYQTQLFFKNYSILPQIAIFNFEQTEYTINASLKFIEELGNNQYLFIMNNNQQLPITLLTRCLQIQSYQIETKKYDQLLNEIYKKTDITDKYNTHELYDLLKYLCSRFIKYKLSKSQLSSLEFQIFNQNTNYTSIFQNINNYYSMYVNSNLYSQQTNIILLRYFSIAQ